MIAVTHKKAIYGPKCSPRDHTTRGSDDGVRAAAVGITTFGIPQESEQRSDFLPVWDGH